MLINKIKEEPGQEIVYTNPDDLPRLGLLLIILALIFMNDDVIAEGTMNLNALSLFTSYLIIVWV